MAITLEKGRGLSLAKGMSDVDFSIEWSRSDLDLDIQAILVEANGKSCNDDCLVFYNQKMHPTGCATLSGDARRGDIVGDGADETIVFNLDKVPANITDIYLTASIHPSGSSMFGADTTTVARIYDNTNRTLLAEYFLARDLMADSCAKICKFTRENGSWKFVALGEGAMSLESMLIGFGFDL